MIQTNSNWFPRWVSWKYEATADQVQDDTDVDNQIIVWFSDEDFDQDYTGFEIEVQMPISPIDTFLSTKSVVEKAMEFKFVISQIPQDGLLVYPLRNG